MSSSAPPSAPSPPSPVDTSLATIFEDNRRKKRKIQEAKELEGKAYAERVERAVLERWRRAFDAAVLDYRSTVQENEFFQIRLAFQDSPELAQIILQTTIDLREFNSVDAEDIVRSTINDLCPPSLRCEFKTFFCVLHAVVYKEKEKEKEEGVKEKEKEA
jgi:hypothetical protein